MPTLKEAKAKVQELSKKALDAVEDSSLSVSDLKTLLNGEDGKSGIEADIKKWTDEVQSLTYVEEKRRKFAEAAGQSVEDLGGDDGQAAKYKSLGAQFVNSDNYKSMLGKKTGSWSSGPVELKTTFSEGTSGTQGPGYAIPSAVPQLIPGILDIRFPQLTIADLFPNGSTNSTVIRYLVETALVNGAGTVKEGGLKPESGLTFASKDEFIKKIATFLPITDEMLEDWAQAQSYIDQRLTLFVKQAEEVQLLSGDGNDPNLLGLLNRSGLGASVTARANSASATGAAVSPAADNDMDAVYREITYIRTTAFLEPDAIVIDPTAWQTILLSKNSQGQYYANGPFASAETPALWGKRVVVTPAMAAGTALVGAFQQGGQIFRKSGLTVEASNSHADFFQRNLTALRAEERLGLAVYRPGAFGQVLGL